MEQFTPSYEDIPVFSPSRAAPIYRRAVRRYPCHEPLALTQNFRQMSFKLNNRPDLIIRDIRLCMPLKVQIQNQTGTVLQMRANELVTTANLAVSADPLSAFHQIECYINGKRHAQRHSEYGHILSSCYQSKDEIGFSDNNSLKPMILRDPEAGVDTPPHVIAVRSLANPNNFTGQVTLNQMQSKVGSQAFNLLESNTGFMERARRWQDGLDDAGTTWEGVITSKLNVGPFSARSRGDDNSAYPYISDLAVNFSFDERISSIDAKYSTIHSKNSFQSRLFEWATPVNIRHFNHRFDAAKEWVAQFDMTWTAKPFIEIEYVEMRALLPEYRLRSFQHECYRSKEVIATIAHGEIQQTTVHPVDLTVRLTSVPTKLYLNAELVQRQRDAFLFGGTKRNCILENIKIRVNQATNLVDDPTQKLMYEWNKLHTNNALLYPTWQKSPLYVFSPSEIAHEDFLANNAGIMTINIAADLRVSQLQCEEYSGIESVGLQGLGYRHNNNWLTTQDGYSYVVNQLRRTADICQVNVTTAQGGGPIALDFNPSTAFPSYFQHNYFRVTGGNEIFGINRINPTYRVKFVVRNAVWKFIQGGAESNDSWRVPVSDECTAIPDGSLWFDTKNMFSTTDTFIHIPFAVAENTQGQAWRPATNGVLIGGANQALPQITNPNNDLTAYWFCIVNDPNIIAPVQVQGAFTVGVARQQFGTPRNANVANNPTALQILNQRRTAALDELRFEMKGLFEFGNDQLVYRNVSEVPEERTNLIVTNKAPGIF